MESTEIYLKKIIIQYVAISTRKVFYIKTHKTSLFTKQKDQSQEIDKENKHERCVKLKKRKQPPPPIYTAGSMEFYAPLIRSEGICKWNDL